MTFSRPWHKKIRGIRWIVSLDGSGGYDFRIPQNRIPQNRIVSLESYRIPQIVSLNRIPQIESYRGIRFEGYDSIRSRDTIFVSLKIVSPKSNRIPQIVLYPSNRIPQSYPSNRIVSRDTIEGYDWGIRYDFEGYDTIWGIRFEGYDKIVSLNLC